MGMLAKKLSGEVLSNNEAIKTEPEELTGPWFSISFTTEDESLKNSLANLVSERNQLVHHFLEVVDLTSSGGRSTAIKYLDQQYENAQNTCEHLRDVENRRLQIAELLESEAGQQALDIHFFCSANIIGILNYVAREKARPDGWTELSAAGQIIAQNAPEEFAKLKAAYKQRTLKGLFLAMDWGELFEESISTGGTRVLYRMKAEHVTCWASVSENLL